MVYINLLLWIKFWGCLDEGILGEGGGEGRGKWRRIVGRKEWWEKERGGGEGGIKRKNVFLGGGVII